MPTLDPFVPTWIPGEGRAMRGLEDRDSHFTEAGGTRVLRRGLSVLAQPHGYCWREA